VAITQWILGIRPTYDGLIVDPVIPAEWSGFSAERTFRGVKYSIQVERRGAGNHTSLEVDGQPVPGTLVPLPASGTESVRVRVVLE
jgi:cellobiose phosphorylase